MNPTSWNRRRGRHADSEHVLFLKWLLMLAVTAFAFAAAWYYGLLGRVWSQDPTGLTIIITLIFLGAAAQGGIQVARLSKALAHADRVRRIIEHHPGAVPAHPGLIPVDGRPHLPPGCVTDHIARLIRKSEQSKGALPLDQRPLLETFESGVARGGEFGWFVADLLLSLGLFGTVIGFILMLAPLSAIEVGNTDAMTQALSAMSTGMAVALYTTLAGLAGGALLKIQGFLLDDAVHDLLRRTTELTEIHVLPELERRQAQKAMENGRAAAA